jgi:hypothetical protein
MEELKVLSASRRTDLVGCYPEVLVKTLEKHPPETVHTLVIWTKNPAPMLDMPGLRKILQRYEQIYLHLTVTGFGGSPLEPGIPHQEKILGRLPELVEMVKGPERISWRFDPIIHLKQYGEPVCNLDRFRPLARKIASLGIKTCRISWMEPYGKVIGRLKKNGYLINNPPLQERQLEFQDLLQLANDLGIQLNVCAIKGFDRSRCIDGELFQRLHPANASCSQRRARNQRKLCGCTESLDIGWYSQFCHHRCLYCYANPQAGSE